MAEDSEQTVLYDGEVPVTLRLSERESRRENLSIKLSSGTNKSQHNQRFLTVQVTSEADPFLLYLFDVTEEDFQALKADQSLLVDFSKFPDFFIELLEHCIRTGREGTPQFAAQLSSRGGSSQLSIVETTQFKQISHLALTVRAGNDAAVKKYLAQRVHTFKTKLESVQRSYLDCQRALSDKSSALDGSSREVRELQELQQRQAADLRAQHAQAMAALKEKMLESQQEAVAALQLEHRDALAVATEKIQRLESRVEELSKRQQASEQERARLESEGRELATNLRTKENELEASRADQARLLSEWREANQSKFELEKRLGESGMRISALEQQVKGKDEMLAKERELYERICGEKGTLEKSLAAVEASYQKAQEQLEGSCSEIVKGNEIIERLQSELRGTKSKLKLRNALFTQLEQEAKQRQAATEGNLKEIAALKEQLAMQTSAAESLRHQLEQAHAKQAESEKLLQSNQQVIQWLNNQINESQLTRSPGIAAGHSSFSFRPSVGLPQAPPLTAGYAREPPATAPSVTPLYKSAALSTPATVAYRGPGALAGTAAAALGPKEAPGKDTNFLKYLTATPPPTSLSAVH
eukprot:tig00020614_g12215.t1